MHQKINSYVKELIKLYKRSNPLFELDHLQEGFEWIDVNNSNQSIFSFIRNGKKENDFLLIICNFTGVCFQDYKVGVPKQGEFREIFNSDSEKFGGTGSMNKKKIIAIQEPFHDRPFSINITIPRFGFLIIRPVKKRKERKGHGKEKMRSHAVGRRERKQA
jgi:1,4-alpha-glucan branching enzyme